MGLIKRGQKWYVQLRHNGRLIRIATGTHNRKLAGEIEAKIKTELVEGKYFDKRLGNKITFEELSKKYMSEYAIAKPRDSKRRDQTCLKHLLPVFANKYLSQITPNMIHDYIIMRRGQSASPSSINKELALAKHMYYIAIKQLGWVAHNPFTQVPLEKLPQPRVRFLTTEEFNGLYEACDDWLKPITVFAVNTGARLSNILDLRWQDVDLNRSMITLEHTKNNERLGLFMTETVRNLLKELNKVRHINSPYVFHDKTGGKLSASTVQHSFHRACKKAGIQDFRFHDLRHTFASWLVQKGASLYEVQKLLGHKTIAMTMRYAHLAPDNLRSAINLLDNKESDHKSDHSEQIV